MNVKSIHYRFGIDFAPVQKIPENPTDRLPYFNAFKDLLKNEKSKIRSWHRTGAGGREVIQAHTGLIDEILRHLVASLGEQETYADASPLDEFALIAVGGYGRGELNPCSDIDLLFLRPNRIKRSTNNFIQEVISLLWGIGLEIGQSCRTLQDCLALAKEDLTVKTSMIETRFLIGDKTQYEKFSASIAKNVLKKNIRTFLDAKLKEKTDRLASGDAVIGDPEPNIKEGPGGLRDYHNSLWATAVRFGCLSLREIGHNDAISDDELDILYESVNFSLRVRNELHYLLGKKSDVLNLEIQKDLAANLGYEAENPAKAVEKFMRHYFLHATNISRYSDTIFQLCYQSRPSIKKVISSFTQKALSDGFYMSDSTLTMPGDAGELFQNNRSLLLTAFDLCRQHDLEPDYQLKRQIRLHKHLIDDAFLNSAVIKDFLFSLLEKPDSEKVLRSMHDTGVLGQLIPEFGHVHCLVSYDFYHRYTADEHSLRMVGFLEGLATPLGKQKVPELAEIYEQSPRKPLLKITALLQSTGKDRGREASAIQKNLLSDAADRLQLDSQDKETLSFLVENLYEMVETGLHQDIHQREVIERFARTVATCDRLDLLYLISYVELRAVAPGTWTSWKKVVLSDLYQRTKQYILRPESLDEQPQAIREGVYKAMHWESPLSEIEDHLDRMPDDYLLSTRPEEVALHIRLIRSLQDKPFIMNHGYNEEGGYHLLTFCGQAKLEVFEKLMGTLTSKNINILGTRIFLKKDGIVIIAIEVEKSERLTADNLEVWKEVKELLADVFEGKKDLRTLLATRARFAPKVPEKTAIVPKIQIDNPAEGPFTVIRIEARDHLGMLYKIAKTFAEFNIQIHRAKIATKGNRGIDVFYVSLRNQKVVFPKLIRRIKERILHVLLMEKLEDIY